MRLKSLRSLLILFGFLLFVFGLILDPIRGMPSTFGVKNLTIIFIGLTMFSIGISTIEHKLNNLIKIFGYLLFFGGVFYNFITNGANVISLLQVIMISAGLIISGLNFIIIRMTKKILSPVLSTLEHVYHRYPLLREITFFIGLISILGALNYSIFIDGSLTFSNHNFIFFVVGILFILLSLLPNKEYSDPSKNIENSKATLNKINYRPEIDGLRALAVIPVILYHLKIKGFEGGFVGVDVFFVISGFLITSIIFSEVQHGSFSIVNFYERRIRRIFPALFLVLFFAGLTGYWIFDINTFKDLCQSIFSTTFFTSNFLLWHQAGYFDKPAELKPLLHTWSLAVEEQFYIFFPLLFMLVWRLFKKYFKIILLTFAIVSFGLSQIWLTRDASANFYLLQFRAWELLLGSLLAVDILPSIKNKAINMILGLLGLIMILYSVFTFTATTPFPGAAALLPTIGTLLIIYSSSTNNTITGSILSLKPLVFTGKISYSLYLWHWVLIVFARYYNIIPLNAWQNILIFVLTFVISTLTWKFIENPFRNKKVITRNIIFSFGISVMLCAGFAAYFLYSKNVLSDRFNLPPLPKYSKTFNNDDKTLINCLSIQDNLIYTDVNDEDKYKEFIESICSIGHEDSPVTFSVIGDSHIASLSYGLDYLSQKSDIKGTIFYDQGCIPYLDINRQDNSACLVRNIFYINYLNSNPNIKTVYLIGRWSEYVNGTRYKLESGNDVEFSYLHNSMEGNNKEIIEYGITTFITKLEEMGVQVIFVNDVPEVGYLVPENYYIANRINRDINLIIAPTRSEFNLRYEPVFEIVTTLKENHPKLKVINLFDAFCDENMCIVEKDGFPLYRDDDHLNYYGSMFVAENVKNFFDDVSK